ncbi:MAG TPA: YdcF family protein [Chthonomonadaceae bacterium]|nr:YdcF family protein [Chthonomonadaceae bacterium]
MKILKASLMVAGVPILVAAWAATTICAYSSTTTNASADAALVLGAAVRSGEPSPIFRERINHAIELYRSGRVQKILFTGGSNGDLTESVAAKNYALKKGIPASVILTEDQSHTTIQNLRYAQRVAQQSGLRSFLLVSDPLHMKRAMVMAQDLGLDVKPSPTPTTLVKTPILWLRFLGHETWSYTLYRIGLGS